MIKKRKPGRPRIETLTRAQWLTLQWVRAYISIYRYAPTVREIGEGTGRSGASVRDLLAQLVAKGYVERSSSPRALVVTHKGGRAKGPAAA